jgi:protein-S-isoprenylcysteine O-methyltransferase Ste14
MGPMSTVIICLAYIFALSEIILVFSKRSKRKTVKRKRDRGSLIALYVVFTVSMTAGFHFADLTIQGSSDYFIIAAGFLVFILGIIIRWTSIMQLKKDFTVDVAINKGHELKINGLYKIVRHPGYLGLFMTLTGLAVSMNSILSFLAISLPSLLVILYRIYVEEVVLTEEFGDKYRDYIKSTKKIIPFIY